MGRKVSIPFSGTPEATGSAKPAEGVWGLFRKYGSQVAVKSFGAGRLQIKSLWMSGMTGGT